MKRKRKKSKQLIDAISSTLFSLMMVAYVAAHVFDFHIWFISELTIVQFILLIVGGNVLLHGIRKIIDAINYSPNRNEEDWGRWNASQAYTQYNEDYSFKGSVPPPPPKDGSFSSQSTKETNKYEFEYDTEKTQTYTKDFKEQLKKQFKQQKDYYTDEYDHSKRNDDHEHYDSNANYEQYSNQTIYQNTFIGDFKFKDSYWQLKPMELSAFIGDALVDVTRAEIPLGETRIRMNTFIGDLKVHLPNDPRLGVKVNINAFIGESKLYDETRSGFGLGSSMETPHFAECERRIVVELNSFIGDVNVKRVG